MERSGRSFVTVLLVALLVAGVLVAITLLVPDVRKEAGELAKSWGPGRLKFVGIVLAGLAAPIVYVFKQLAKGIRGVLPDSHREGEIAKDNAAIKSSLAQLQADIAARDEARRRELDDARRRIAELEVQVAAKKEEIRAVDRQIQQLKVGPQREMTRDEVLEFWKSAPGNVE
jgi:hypothetical protein